MKHNKILPNSRQLRIASLLRQNLANFFIKHSYFVTISEVTISCDLRYANVFVYSLQDSSVHNCTSISKELNSKAVYIRKELAQTIHLKYMPELRFYRDDSFDKAHYIERVLQDSIS